MREETLTELTGEDGALLAVVTRNRYGAEVLNTERALFADIDVPELAKRRRRRGGGGGRGLLAGLRRMIVGAPPESPQDLAAPSLSRAEPAPPEDPDELMAAEPVCEFAQHHPELGVRLYRTRPSSASSTCTTGSPWSARPESSPEGSGSG